MTTVVTANIGRNIGSTKVRADLNAIKEKAPRALIGFQEIDEADPAAEHGILKEVFGETHDFVNFESRVPVAVPKKWDVIKTKVIRLSPGVSKVSPPRLATEVWVQTKHGVVVYLNFHLIAGAWNAKIESTQKVRRDYWWEAVDKLRDRINNHVKAGRTVVWMGDVNRMDMVKLHKDERRIVTGGIDSISVIEGDVRVTQIEEFEVKLASDHDAKGVKFKPAERRRNLTPPPR